MPTSSPRSGSVIQGSFQGGKPTVLQLAQPAIATASIQAKAPLPFAATGSVPKPVIQAKTIAPPPIRFPGQAPIQTKPVATTSVLPSTRFTVPLPKPAVPPKTATVPSLQPKAMQLTSGGEAFEVPATLNLTSPGGGQRLPESVQQKMEAFFGTSFADVRVHVGAQAASIGALAFTHGSNLYFAPGQYNPHTAQGQQLLGHELTHVVQQRAGRVRNPFGSGVAVVQDHAMEAEADRMGQRAAAHTIQAKPATGGVTVQRSTPVNVSGMTPVGNGSYRIVVGAVGRPVGSVMVHQRGRSAIEITDLAVDSSHRKQGLGGVLMASAMRAGLRLGMSKVTLASQDNGSGRLTSWYRSMGFAPTGANKRGYPVLEAPISRGLSGVAPGRIPPPAQAANNQSSKGLRLPFHIGRSLHRSGTIQAMEAIEIEAEDDESVDFIALLGLNVAPMMDTKQINLGVTPPAGRIDAASLAAWKKSIGRLKDGFVGVTDLRTMTHHMYPSFSYDNKTKIYSNGDSRENLTKEELRNLYGSHYILMESAAPGALGARSGVQHKNVADRVGVGPAHFIGWSIVGTADPRSKPEVRFVSGRNTTKFRGRRLSFGGEDRDERDMPAIWRSRLEEDLARDLNIRIVREGVREGHHHKKGRTAECSVLRTAQVTEDCNLRDDSDVSNILCAIPSGAQVRVAPHKTRWFSLSFPSLPRKHVWVEYNSQEGWVRIGAFD